MPALARHAHATSRAFDGTWDGTAAKEAKAWCDELLKMVRAQGDVPRQTVGAALLTTAIRAFAASSNSAPARPTSGPPVSRLGGGGVLDLVYARCADGVVWLLKHCRALTLTKGAAGTVGLEKAAFECVEALLAALATSSTGGVPTELYRNVTPLLSDVVPQLTSRLGLGIAGVAGTESAVALLRALATALLLFDTGMRPYLGPLRGALLRAQLFEHTTVGLQRLAARCWSLVCLSRSRVAVRGSKGGGGHGSYGSAGINGLSTVPAQYWEAECMRVVTSMQELVGQMCPASAQGLKLATNNTTKAGASSSASSSSPDAGGNDQALLSALRLTDTWPVNEVLVAARLETLATALSSMLSIGPAGAGLNGRSGGAQAGEAMVSIPVLSIVDVLDRLIICALNSQVTAGHASSSTSSSSSGGGLSAQALRALVPRLYAAFASVFAALVDAVGTPLLRYANRIGRTIVQALKFVSHTALEDASSLGHGCPCPGAMASMLECASRLAWRHGAALKQSFVEPVVLLCVREIKVRMVSQPNDSLMLGRISADGGGGKGKRRGKGKGKKRGRNGGSAASSSSGVATVAAATGGAGVTRLSKPLLPVSAAAAEAHRHSCRACLFQLRCDTNCLHELAWGCSWVFVNSRPPPFSALPCVCALGWDSL